MYFNLYLIVISYPEMSLTFLSLKVLVFNFSMCLGLPQVACHSILYPTVSNFNYFASEKQTFDVLLVSVTSCKLFQSLSENVLILSSPFMVFWLDIEFQVVIFSHHFEELFLLSSGLLFQIFYHLTFLSCLLGNFLKSIFQFTNYLFCFVVSTVQTIRQIFISMTDFPFLEVLFGIFSGLLFLFS